MLPKPYNYNIFFDFIESYQHLGFANIKLDDPIITKLNELLDVNNQCFSVFEMRQMKYLYTSQRCEEMIGIDADELNINHWRELVHPAYSERIGMIRSQVFRIEKDIFMAGKGSAILSYNLSLRHPKLGYSQMLFQDYFFYSPTPLKTLYIIQVLTNIDAFDINKSRQHYYCGTNLNLFKFPDEALLKVGTEFSTRELEIIKLASQSLDSEQIAKQLFVSVHTINTHRRNILKKSKKAHFSELIYALKSQGTI